MFYVSVVMGLLVGFLVNAWLTLATLNKMFALIVSVIVAVVVTMLTWVGKIPHF